MHMTPSIRLIYDIVSGIDPYDEPEVRHRQDVLDWIESGAPLFRITKPDNPPKHLVSYFILYDESADKLILIDHIKAKAWLPAGGHVEPGEDPRMTVAREAAEELGVAANFSTRFGSNPLFVTVGATKGHGSHTDVSLWYVIAGDSTAELTHDPEEMHSYKWLTLKEVLATDIMELDPHMHRFVRKMQVNH